MYIYFLIYVVIFIKFSTSIVNAETYKITKIELSKPYELNFNKQIVIENAFENAFKELIKKDVKIIFTVDCGTLSYEPIELAQKTKVDVIVLDHHQSDIQLPQAHALINPNRHDESSDLNYLCAAGVCFMFLVALNKSKLFFIA